MQTKNPDTTKTRRGLEPLAHANGAFDWKGTQPGAGLDVVDWLIQKVTARRSELADRRRGLRL